MNLLYYGDNHKVLRRDVEDARLVCCLLLWILMGGFGPKDTTPAFAWTGPWEKTGLTGSYHSYVKLDDGRVACFCNRGLSKLVCDCPSLMFPGAIAVSFTREPGNLLTWTPSAPLMTWEGILDLPDPSDRSRPAPNRLMTRPTVVRLPSGYFLGLGAISRDYPPVDGLYYVTSFAGSMERVKVVKEALLAGREVPMSEMWKYQGKVTGPVGEYQDKVQVPNSMYTDVGNLIFLPDGAPKPDHARPTRNRFLLFANYLGAPELKKDGWLWTTLCYSADGRKWFFAKDPTGVVRNLTPFPDGGGLPFVFRHAPDEWWMWRTVGTWSEPGTDTIVGAREICLYYSPDGLNWRQVRTDVSYRDFLGADGRPLGLKNMSIYYDEDTRQIHGMLSVWDDIAQGWCKYHNLAKVSRR